MNSYLKPVKRGFLNLVYWTDYLIFLPQFVLLNIFKLTILHIVDYGSVMWLDCPKVTVDKRESFQNYAMRSIDRFDCQATKK